jgi:hypothetical protein
VFSTSSKTGVSHEYGFGQLAASAHDRGHERAQALCGDAARPYHGADIQPLVPHELAAIPPDRLVNIVLKPHPATRVIRSRFSAVTIFTANRGDRPAGRVEAVEPEDALLTRPTLEVEVRRLPPGGAIFLSRLMTGESLGAAASAAFSESPSFDLAANIRGILEAGAFTTILCGES